MARAFRERDNATDLTFHNCARLRDLVVRSGGRVEAVDERVVLHAHDDKPERNADNGSYTYVTTRSGSLSHRGSDVLGFLSSPPSESAGRDVHSPVRSLLTEVAFSQVRHHEKDYDVVDIDGGDAERASVSPQLFLEGSYPATAYPFRPPHVLWASASEESLMPPNSSALTRVLWNSQCTEKADRRLAASDGANLPKPSADAAIAQVAKTVGQVFGGSVALTSLPGFIGDVLDSGLLSLLGMVMSSAIAALETDVGELWMLLSTKMLQLAGEVARYVDETENKIDFEINRKDMIDLQGHIDMFFTQISVRKVDPGRPPEPTGRCL